MKAAACWVGVPKVSLIEPMSMHYTSQSEASTSCCFSSGFTGCHHRMPVRIRPQGGNNNEKKRDSILKRNSYDSTPSFGHRIFFPIVFLARLVATFDWLRERTFCVGEGFSLLQWLLTRSSLIPSIPFCIPLHKRGRTDE